MNPRLKNILTVVLIIIALIAIIKDVSPNAFKKETVYSVQVKYGKLGEDATISEYIDGRLTNVEFLNPIYCIAAGGKPEDIAKLYIRLAKENNLADVYVYNGKEY